MRNPKRIDAVLQQLGIYWKANPDLRLCQIIGNFFDCCQLPRSAGDEQDMSGRAYNLEDETFLGYLLTEIEQDNAS
jgi:uncharacterized protein YihD (DUF1040 family)